ncbi:pol polyprotein [Nephila pilipes]|uniref:Pol polyprotein n=1 Tax=Nephila pilipes TaxID=299642 RepID=A0A8X6PNR3_NEPPI|nr:pol polyprotein [Nephila pilipes]
MASNHRQVRDMVKDSNTESQDLPYYKAVRWLSCEKVMSRVFELRKKLGPIDYHEIALSPTNDSELTNLLNSENSLNLKKVKLPNSDVELYCDFSTNTARPYIPEKFRKICFDCIHNFAHPAIKTTYKLTTRGGTNTHPAYHPQSNGLTEEFHRPLKAAIMCHATDKWTEVLPTILLSLRASLKENIGYTSAELVYGKTLRLPGEFFDYTQANSDPAQLGEQLRHYMQQLKPKPIVSHAKQAVFVHKDLKARTHVFVRRDSVRRSLQAPYDEPFLVLKRSDKRFKVNIYVKPSPFPSIE